MSIDTGATVTGYEPIDFVLFGTLGDLARRKLLPSLFQLEKANLLNLNNVSIMFKLI